MTGAALSRPELSVVVVASRGEPIRAGLFAALAPAVTAGRVEILDVRDRPGAADPRARACLAPAGSTVPRRRALGLRAAAADRVAITESFCEPAPGWAEALLDSPAAADAVAIGGPVDRRGGGAVGWAATFCEYGRFLPGRAAGPADDLSSVNVAYDRRRLERVLGGLPDALWEYELHAALRRRGERFWYEPRAVVYDAGAPGLAELLRSQRLHGRLHGGRRAAGIGAPRRLLRALAAPGVAPLLFFRLARRAASGRRGGRFARAAAPLALLVGAWAAGEGLGYLAGPGDAEAAWT